LLDAATHGSHGPGDHIAERGAPDSGPVPIWIFDGRPRDAVARDRMHFILAPALSIAVLAK